MKKKDFVWDCKDLNFLCLFQIHTGTISITKSDSAWLSNQYF